ncbi:MAG: UMP kinase [Candidatus Woesearchaeota archaeon]
MASEAKLVVLSLGGSIVVPDAIDMQFLKEFRRFILDYLKKGYRFIIVVGGGKTCRNYQNAANQISSADQISLDWLGIQVNYLNAYLIKTILGKGKIINNPARDKPSGKVILAFGTTPGRSSDYTAVLLAKSYSAKTIINITNVDYVYTQDPKKHPDAEPIKQLAWKDYFEIIRTKWEPGLNTPFDPAASKLAQKMKIKVVILSNDLKNIKAFLNKKPFKGTTIGNI